MDSCIVSEWDYEGFKMKTIKEEIQLPNQSLRPFSFTWEQQADVTNRGRVTKPNWCDASERVLITTTFSLLKY